MLEEDKKKKFYRPADYEIGCCSKPKFDLRFERMQGSIINKGFCEMLSRFNELRK